MNIGQWFKPSLAVIAQKGLPTDLNTAGNVVYKELTYRVSVRTAPTHDPEILAEQLRKAIMDAPESITYGAKVEFNVVDKGSGFCAPDLPQDMKRVVY